MKVVINNKRVNLDNKDVLGSGGEAVVLRYGSEAVKLYHDPTSARARKLEELLQMQLSLPAEVVCPSAPVYDQSGATLLGFTMPALPDRLAALSSLSNKGFRAAHGVTLCQVTSLFLRMHAIVEAIHRAGLVVGDFNDLNVLFEATEPAFIDVDSYQFGAYPCPVATEPYLDPQLYGLDLSARPSFRPEHDWYSFAVLFFRSLLLAHPYGGTHPHIKQLTQRAEQRVTVFHPEVTYPKIALSPNFLNDELAGVFHQIFGQGWRGVFPGEVLTQYAADLTECSTCRAWFPASRRVCPACQGQLAFVLPKFKVAAGIRAEELIVALGPIIAFKIIGERLYCVAREENLAVLYTKEPGQPSRRIELFKWLSGARYDFMDGYLVVNPHASPDLLLLELAATGVKQITKTTTGRFNGQAVFATTAQALYRTAGGMLLRGEIKYGQLVERPVTAIQEGQSWFQVGTDRQGQEIITGFSRVFRDWQWFGVERVGRSDLPISVLEADEAVTEWAVKPGLILRKTRQAGVAYLRLDAFDAKGQAVFAQRRKLQDDDESQNIETALYSGGVALWPGTNGLVKEQLEQRQRTELSATGPYVNAATRLGQFSGGLVAATDNQIWSLVLV